LKDSPAPVETSSRSPFGIARAVSLQPRLTIEYLPAKHRFLDALQKLKIIPKDKMYIDFTGSPPPSPRVKREKGAASIKREAGVVIKAERSIGKKSSEEQHDKKRKAMQDELEEVELEQREVRLEQRRLRLKKALAGMEGRGK